MKKKLIEVALPLEAINKESAREKSIRKGMAEGERLVEEMAGMRVRVTASGREQYGTWRAGEHDDLVLAVALACWGGRQFCPDGVYGSGFMQREGL